MSTETVPEVAAVPPGNGLFPHEEDRRRLSPVTIKAALRVIEAWGATAQEGAALLGVSHDTWDLMATGQWKGVLSEEQMTRASAVIGLYKDLHLLFASELADLWPRLPNRGPLFEWRTPIDAMIEDGIPHMLRTRRYIESMA